MDRLVAWRRARRRGAVCTHMIALRKSLAAVHRPRFLPVPLTRVDCGSRVARHHAEQPGLERPESRALALRSQVSTRPGSARDDEHVLGSLDFQLRMCRDGSGKRW